MELLRISPSLYPKLAGYLKTENSRNANYSFANLVMWSDLYMPQFCFCGDRLISLYARGDEKLFSFPVGKGDIAPAFALMREYCRENGVEFKLGGVNEEQLAEISALFPDEFVFEEDRDSSDYIYLASELSDYPGRALHAKRNFCNRFESEHEWSFVPLSEALLPDCFKMLDKWTERSIDRLTPDIVCEHKAIERGFAGYSALSLEGGALFADSELIGWSVGEMISDDTFCVHFEKAYHDIDGAYPMLCREMARLAVKSHPEIHYVNREDDMGNPALRRSKLSYKPDHILTKYIVREK